MTDLRKAAEDLLEVVEAAIKAGDWKVDGACDLDSAIVRLRQALAQPEREWVPLTVTDLKEARKECHGGGPSYRFAYWVERICREKNT